MNLTSRDRATLQASLLLIHDEGGNPDDVTRMAQTIMDGGTPPEKAYARAFASFLETAPGFRAGFMRIEQLMTASDDRTVAGYNVALARHIAGEEGAFDAIMPSLQQDLAAMAARTGDAGFIDGWGNVDSTRIEPPATPTEAVATAPEAPRPGWGMTGYRSPQSEAARETREAQGFYTGVRGAQPGEPATYGPGPGPISI